MECNVFMNYWMFFFCLLHKQVRIDEVVRQWSGSLMIGLTTQTVSESQPIIVTQSTALELNSNSSKHTWIVNGPKGKHCDYC